MPTKVSAKHHPHDDAPDTADAFRKLAKLPAGQQRDTLREQIVEAWLPMAERLAGRFRSRGESFEDLRPQQTVGVGENANQHIRALPASVCGDRGSRADHRLRN